MEELDILLSKARGFVEEPSLATQLSYLSYLEAQYMFADSLAKGMGANKLPNNYRKMIQ